ncbi:NAD-dependent epimerase/dehydratase [Thalassoporum mexicanum PCC 7367]|uniref:NAD-dependent epimerase/dehydratase family protein n=1 Tax=Thalassoporum mexicanum TaxID=3457544 RepID=UPI00029F8BB5|nr:NAD-dependent epimerase/dehydratase family protein [Pseudanabaena sp. PCC 7367]AFY69748.1 NAD-dependent epimerase/dehydratase [Pseudanabaena sp. PCC 7367]
MAQVELLITGATGLTGTLLLQRMAIGKPDQVTHCLVRPTSDHKAIDKLDLHLHYVIGDSAIAASWSEVLADIQPSTIVHIASIRHIDALLAGIQANQAKFEHLPRLIIVGTTGIYSQYNQYGQIYTEREASLAAYAGDSCLLRPTMIYGSERDKNLHKLIKFCDRYGFFPVFGDGSHLLQPIHADDLAQAILAAIDRPQVNGTYDVSGGTVVTFRELLALVAQLINKPVRQLALPLNVGVALASLSEIVLKRRSPVRREQILRLQEDKAYAHDLAQQKLDFKPRSLADGLQQEVELMRQKGII